MEMDNVETIKRAVEMGLGVSVLPARHGAARGRARARWSPSRSPRARFTRPIGMLVRKGKYLDRASQAVLDAFKAAAKTDD